MPSDKGSYALIFHASQPFTVRAGAQGLLAVEPGYLIYCGSAFGPGGVRARTAHHRAISHRPHWHIDYLRPKLELLEIWYTFDPQRREHDWAMQLVALRGASTPFAGFGSTDCQCRSHLIATGFRPSFAGFRKRLRKRLPQHAPFYREVLEGAGRSE